MRGLSLALLLVVVGCESRGVPAAGDASSFDGEGDLGRTTDLELPPGLGPAYVDEVVRACVIATGCSLRSLPWRPNDCVSAVAVCVDGIDRRIDCQTLGFKGCWWKICNNEL